MGKNSAELYLDTDGDLVVVFRRDGQIEHALASYCGRPRGTQTTIIDDEFDPGLSDQHSFIATVSGDLARLYVEHGCSLYDFETDRQIWASEYVRYMSDVMATACNIERKIAGAQDASEWADEVVWLRWLAKAKAKA